MPKQRKERVFRAAATDRRPLRRERLALTGKIVVEDDLAPDGTWQGKSKYGRAVRTSVKGDGGGPFNG